MSSGEDGRLHTEDAVGHVRRVRMRRSFAGG